MMVKNHFSYASLAIVDHRLAHPIRMVVGPYNDSLDSIHHTLLHFITQFHTFLVIVPAL